jgi:hypothetical protein
MTVLIDMVNGGENDLDSTILYAHLGGQPALGAYARAFPESGSEPQSTSLEGLIRKASDFVGSPRLCG